MSRVKEETGLAVREESSGELAPTAHAAAVQAEVQAAIIVAKRFPRNEDLAYEKLMKACRRTSFADDAIYSYPRGGTDIEGPSVNLAREAARVWGNIEYGFVIVRDEDDERHIRGWAWDKETNARNFSESSFKKLIYRKGKGNIVPDERELRELTNKHGAILERNSVLKAIPKDFIEDAMELCLATLKQSAEQDPDGARKKLILAFSELNVTPEMLEKRLGHPLAASTAKEIADLRKIYASIRDGNSTWSDHHVNGAPTEPTKKGERGKLDVEDLKPKESAAATTQPSQPGQGGEKHEPGSVSTPPPQAADTKDKGATSTVDPEEKCTAEQFDQLQAIANDNDVPPKVFISWVKEILKYKMVAHLRQRDFDRAVRFLKNGGKE